MTFTRARHNPLSLVILNERRFCASEGPRRAARTGGPHHARLWRDGVGDASRSLRGNTRAFGTLPYHPPAKLAPPRPLSEVEGTREESAFLPLLSMHPPATQKSATTLSPFMGEITIGSTCRPHPRNRCQASRWLSHRAHLHSTSG